MGGLWIFMRTRMKDLFNARNTIRFRISALYETVAQKIGNK